MATRSRIGIELTDGSVLSVYHHWDGYPQWLGRILKTHYNTRQQVVELIDGGDMSSCWTDSIQYSEEGRTDEYDYYAPDYYSRRGEDCPPRHDANRYDYLAEGEEYAYLFTRNDEWICWDRHEYGTRMPEIVEIPTEALAV